MADSTIDSELIVLHNKWRTVAKLDRSIPQDGFTGTGHHNVATAAYPLGTTIAVECDGSVGKAGTSEFIYLQLVAQDADNLLAVKHVVALDDGAIPFGVTNEVASLLTAQKGPIAVALSAMTTGSYGWFWCGGVCPEEYVAGLGGNYATTNAVAIGDMTWGSLASANTTYGEIGFDVADAAGETVIGVALAADAA